MALAKSTKRADLIVANTSNVKEMKNGRPMNIQLAEGEGEQANCIIVTLGAVLDDKAGDHVFVATVLEEKKAIEDAVAAGTAYVVVAPEIMVEEARMTDGHIGLFRLEEGEVYTAYQLHKHDRLEVSSNHPLATLKVGTEISRRPMASGLVMQPVVSGALYDGAKLEMVKIEF